MSEIITAVKVEGGFDVTDAMVQAWALDRYRRLVAESQWRREEVSLGATVVGTVRYALPDTVVDVRSLKVGTAPYKRVSVEELWDAKANLSSWSCGVFAPGFGATETAEYVELYPAPTEAGETITALAAILPADVSLSTAPAIPRDFDHVIVEGCIADGMARTEGRLSDAAQWESLFAAGVEKLRRRRNSRIGSGPSRIRVGR